MNRATCILLLVLIGFGTAPAFADTQADIAEAERQIELRQLAKEIRARAFKRTHDAVRGSSVYKAWVAAKKKWRPIQGAVRKKINEAKRNYAAIIDDNVKKKETPSFLDEMSRLYLKAHEIDLVARYEIKPLLNDWKALEKTLFRKFRKEETLSAVKSNMKKAEREIFRNLMDNLPNDKLGSAIRKELKRQRARETETPPPSE